MVFEPSLCSDHPEANNSLSYTGCFKKELYSGIPNVTLASVTKTFTLKHLERWILRTPLSVNIFVTPATQ
jgi:hypothetical protein